MTCRDPENCQQDGVYQCGCMNGEEMEESITTAAIRVDGEVWTLPRPARHHVLIMAWCWAHYNPEHGGNIGRHEQGFMTSTGRFVDREEAARIATEQGQLKNSDEPCDILTSEDLW